MSDARTETGTEEIHENDAGQGIGSVSNRLNWLRAGVLGANDGIVSVAGIVVGVAAATAEVSAILVAGIAGLLAGAFSMAAGEYVSVSTQRDTEKALLDKERWELANMPDQELDELARMWEAKGISPELARKIAEELTERDALRAHAEIEFGIDPDELTSPWHAALASFVAFTVGALLPMAAIILPPTSLRVPVTFAAVVVALVVTGTVSARLGGAKARRAAIRTVVGGALAMVVTYVVGHLVGVGI
ncbi:VIT1/CCC1 transporter family protein [Actinopolymorpha cephalotaxi]|uniref:VIT1/CCC1 family predicted Fe2+/Mn2+ transporter n=3 Tax=Actinopolymorpha cephalotaxi TaxID=504797 RepID=A0ABX2S6Q4_9ACTN|nr:VIT family protein [Actinopolymorpha cephalotaxi]NYH84718.1 VIT1/CCC1 family predicted Fe2+/Mn2+ transporter [Actinopolymorpha cephalotaxi]